jgi:signal transduction histidine kinase
MLAAAATALIVLTAILWQLRMLAALREENRILAARAAASERLATLGRVVAGVAHEVNNPLTFIANALPTLERAVADGRRAEAESLLRIMGNGTARMVYVARSLRDIARDDDVDPPAPVDLKRALDDALDLLKPDLLGRVEVVRRYHPELQAVNGTPGALGQVLLNLLKNAAQAVEGRRAAQIEVVAEPSNGSVRVGVRDNGPGIDPAALPRIFEPFFTTRGPQGGTGLGLAICRDILQRHGGRIEVDNRPGEGVTFSVYLPPA